MSRSDRSVTSAPVSSSTDVLLFASRVSMINVSRTRFFSDNLVSMYGRLTGGNVHIVMTKLSVSFHNVPFNPVPKLYTVTSRISGMRTVYIGYNRLTSFSRHAIGGSGRMLLKRARRCRPLYQRYCRRTVRTSRGRDNRWQVRGARRCKARGSCVQRFCPQYRAQYRCCQRPCTLRTSGQHVTTVLRHVTRYLSSVPPNRLLPMRVGTRRPNRVRLLHLVRCSSYEEGHLLSTYTSRSKQVHRNGEFNGELLFRQGPQQRYTRGAL